MIRTINDEENLHKVDGAILKYIYKNLISQVFLFFLSNIHNPKLPLKHTPTHLPFLSPLRGFVQAAWQLLSVYMLVFRQRMIGGWPSPLRAASSEPG